MSDEPIDLDAIRARCEAAVFEDCTVPQYIAAVAYSQADVPALLAEVDRERANADWMAEAAEAESGRANAAERERDAYRKAKQENDERFQLEADGQRMRAEDAERVVEMWQRNYHTIADLAEEEIDRGDRYRLAWLSARKRAAQLSCDVDGLMDQDERMLADWAGECDRAERAETRLAAVREYVESWEAGPLGGQFGRRGYLLELIDGEGNADG